MEDFYDVYVPENRDYLMSDPEEDEPAPEPEAPEEEPSEPEPENPEEPVPEELPAELETPPAGEAEDGSETMKDLISAIGDLNETITGAVTEEPEEQPPVLEESGGAGGAAGGGGLDGASPGVDLTSVIELLGEVNDNLVMQHNALLQVQANLDFVFLAVAALIGVVLGVAVGRVFHDLWRA